MHGQMDVREVIDKIVSGNYSLLDELDDSGRLKKDMRIVGRLTRWLFVRVLFTKSFLKQASIRPELWETRLSKVFRRWGRILLPFSAKYHHDFPVDDRGKIFVINHPSLSDPLVTIVWSVLTFPQKPILLPVNLPWFEEIGSFVTLLQRVGIFLVPMLTPKTMVRLNGDKDQAERFKRGFETNYLDQLLKLVNEGGMGVIAQSATRQRGIWLDETQRQTGISADKRKITPSVGMLVASAKKAKLTSNSDVVVVGVMLPWWWRRIGLGKLNLFIPYRLNIGRTIPLTGLPSRADSIILHEMESLLHKSYWLTNKPPRV